MLFRFNCRGQLYMDFFVFSRKLAELKYGLQFYRAYTCSNSVLSRVYNIYVPIHTSDLAVPSVQFIKRTNQQ